MEPAIRALIERYGDSREERPRVRGQAALAVITVDRHGCPIESPAVAVSSFGWGTMRALQGDLAELSQWEGVESSLMEATERRLLMASGANPEDNDARSRPLTRHAIRTTYDDLVSWLGLPGEWVDPPQFAIRSYMYFRDSNPPEPLLLNSFFLSDLALARRLFLAGTAPKNLRQYMGLDHPQARADLLRDPRALAEAVSPKLTHLSRWPSRGRHPLVLLQQAAVNLAFRETESGGMLGINGPPGTGKTTLLRDLVAGVVANRAEAMVKFDDPEKAFEHSGQRIKVGNGWLHLYRLAPSLRGFEVIVASSNNKAVENVSAELPNLDAIAADAADLRYLKPISDAVHRSETWGMIAAVLGNAGNRGRFRQAFWWDEDLGLNSYLSAAAGVPIQIEEIEPETGEVHYRTPRIVDAERPPTTHDEALERWRRARKRFQDALERSQEWQDGVEGLKNDVDELPRLARSVLSASEKRLAIAQKMQNLRDLALRAQQQEEVVARQLHLIDEQVRTHSATRPGFWARLFRTRGAREWARLEDILTGQGAEARARVNDAQAERQRIEIERYQAASEKKSADAAWQASSELHQQVKQRLAKARELGVVVVDDSFFSMDHSSRQQATPWFTDVAQRVRDEVFIAAVAVHRAFADAAAKPLRHNLGALMNAFTTQTLPGVEKQALLPDLWASLFLVVPLISTTFASVNRMLGKMPPESLGLLLVDEAGQAVPQAAVGAIMRSRRAIIVGDPVQIEPVVVLPDTLTHAICRRLGADPERYAAPIASAQTLADAASAYASEFETRSGSRSVGAPLLVHRRCSEPMFGLANSIAYSNLMVFATPSRSNPIRSVLGPSAWIHVEGRGEDKWCAQEGTEVVQLLSRLARAGVFPDLYIITPFVIVADGLRQCVRASGVLQTWIGADQEPWLFERIGTVHTAQGREAEAVILVLGAPNSNQTGARNWAGGRPNLLNVAVTRAKDSLYVVGNRRLWCEAGVFRELHRRLP
jgi:hypothetical protein